MRYRIVNETKHRIRIRMYNGPMTPEQEQVLTYALTGMDGVESISVYRATAGCAITYTCDRQHLLERLDDFRYDNVTMLADTVKPYIDAGEMRDRKIDPALKHKLRMRILAETVADVALPLPLQLGYHAYQLITLKEF